MQFGSGKLGAHSEVYALCSHGVTHVSVVTWVLDQIVTSGERELGAFVKDALDLTPDDLRELADRMEATPDA